MKVIQLLPTMSYGDAIGNDVLALRRILTEQGIDSEIYASNIDKRLSREKIHRFDNQTIEKFDPQDILVYHMSLYSEIAAALQSFPGMKIAIYHNVTPPDFFEDYSQELYWNAAQGQWQVKSLAAAFDHCIADSEYNRDDLLQSSYQCPIDVIPILIDFHQYDATPNQRIIDQYRDGKKNLIFVGRVAPNKKQEDVVRAFHYYQKYFEPESRLFLVGSYNGMESYYHRLLDYTDLLGVKDVIFTGHIPFADILSYYHASDLFISMSEHEGFCVPLLEAMHFHLPILAYDAAAIAGTLGGAGFLLKEKDPRLAAGAINSILSDEELRTNLVHGQNERLGYFTYEQVKTRYVDFFKHILSGNREKS